MNLPRVVILKCTCQVSNILIVEMLIAYTVVAAGTYFQCPAFHKILNIFRVTDSPLVVCICNHMPTGIHHEYKTFPG